MKLRRDWPWWHIKQREDSSGVIASGPLCSSTLSSSSISFLGSGRSATARQRLRWFDRAAKRAQVSIEQMILDVCTCMGWAVVVQNNKGSKNMYLPHYGSLHVIVVLLVESIYTRCDRLYSFTTNGIKRGFGFVAQSFVLWITSQLIHWYVAFGHWRSAAESQRAFSSPLSFTLPIFNEEWRVTQRKEA